MRTINKKEERAKKQERQAKRVMTGIVIALILLFIFFLVRGVAFA